MKRELPVLCGETLTYQHTGVARTLRVGTPDWELWLADAEGFVVSFEDLTFTVRKERAGNQRGEWYWRAYHKHRGKLRRVYVGKVDRLSLTRLQEVGGMFAESVRQGKAVAESEQTAQRLLAAHQAYRRLLATKLFIPPVPPRIIPRLSLFARRYNLLAYRVTLLAAPAGFGKTTLLSEWVQALREASPKQVPASGRRNGKRPLPIVEPGGYIRSIIDEGPVMVGLLQELLASLQAAGNQSSSHVSRRYVEVLLTAAGRRVSTREQHETRAKQALLSSDHATPLSQREGEILRLMAQGMSDREIADHLILSENTIKTYARRIYDKLDVRNRTQAVRRAGELHIL